MNKTEIAKKGGIREAKRRGGSVTSIDSHPKARQSAKIRELRRALLEAGCGTVREQAKALGLTRSTAWMVLQGNHKASGLSASVIKRMLRSPKLPPRARQTIEEYILEKSNGIYGHSRNRLRIFRAQLDLIVEAPVFTWSEQVHHMASAESTDIA